MWQVIPMKEILHIYTRVSSAVQEEGTSLETQKDLGIRKSKELGMDFQIWNEGAASSHHENLSNRPKISELLIELEKGTVKHLFVYNNDRLSRNDQTQFIIKNAIKTNGVILYTKDGTYDLNNPTDKLTTLRFSKCTTLFLHVLESLEPPNPLKGELCKIFK